MTGAPELVLVRWTRQPRLWSASGQAFQQMLHYRHAVSRRRY